MRYCAPRQVKPYHNGALDLGHLRRVHLYIHRLVIQTADMTCFICLNSGFFNTT